MLLGRSTANAKCLVWCSLQVWYFYPYLYNCLLDFLP